MTTWLKELKTFLPILVKQVKSMALGTFLGLTAVLAAMGLFSLSGWFISATAAAGLFTAAAKDFNFFLPSIGVRMLAITRTLARYGERLFCHDATFRILESLRTWFYDHLEPLSPAQLMSFGSGDVLSRIVGDIDALDNLYLRVLSPVLVAGAAVLVLTGFLFGIDPALAVIAAVGLVSAGWGISLLAIKLGHTAGRRLVYLQGQLRGNIVQGVQGMAELLVFDTKAHYLAEIMTNHDQLIARQRYMAHLNGLSSAVLTLISGAAVLGTLFIGVDLVAHGKISGEILTLVTLSVMAAFEAVWSLPAAFQYLNHTRTSANRLMEIVKTPPLVTFPSQTLPKPQGFNLNLQHVSFRYPGMKTWILKDFSLSIPAGVHMAIVGPSGVGKSTLTHLLMRFVDPQEGDILLGGVDIRSCSETDLRQQIILISQKAHIFNGTIRSNLLLANPNAEDQALWRALKTACLDGFVAKLPEGLDTWVGEGGKQLSGGQMRRLAVARAFLHHATIWILDEPTDGLDGASASALMNNLLSLAHGRTLIVVTHRNSILERVDRIIDLADYT